MARLIDNRRFVRPKILSLKDFHRLRNDLVLCHDLGGLGDVLIQRMLFEDFKKALPEARLIFACLPEYMDAVRDHPDINELLDSRKIVPTEYVAFYDTGVLIADRYENNAAPCPEHRSDIWAKFCGLTLVNHDMKFRIPPKSIERARARLNSTKPVVLLAPISAMISKSLLDWQIKVIVERLKGFAVFGIHKRPIPILDKLHIPCINNLGLTEWMAQIAAADYVISVDTAAFHLAGGLKKPLTGIFTFADGKVYGKYFDFVLVQKHRDNGNWDCGPCFKFADCPKCKTQLKPCLTELTEAELIAGIDQMLEKWPVDTLIKPEGSSK